jgi:hypothetical protein
VTTKPDIEAVRAELSVLVKNMSKVATDSDAAPRERLKAIELMLRIAIGPSKRPALDSDVVAGRNALNALSDATICLRQIITSTKSERVRSRAAELAIRIANLKR